MWYNVLCHVMLAIKFQWRLGFSFRLICPAEYKLASKMNLVKMMRTSMIQVMNHQKTLTRGVAVSRLHVHELEIAQDRYNILIS